MAACGQLEKGCIPNNLLGTERDKINIGCPMLPRPSRHKYVVAQDHAIISRSPEAKAQYGFGDLRVRPYWVEPSGSPAAFTSHHSTFIAPTWLCGSKVRHWQMSPWVYHYMKIVQSPPAKKNLKKANKIPTLTVPRSSSILLISFSASSLVHSKFSRVWNKWNYNFTFIYSRYKLVS